MATFVYCICLIFWNHGLPRIVGSSLSNPTHGHTAQADFSNQKPTFIRQYHHTNVTKRIRIRKRLPKSQALNLLTVDFHTVLIWGVARMLRKTMVTIHGSVLCFEKSLQECVWFVVNGLKTWRNAGLILHRRGQTEQLLWQHRGRQTFESPPDAVCLLWHSCYCTLVALWGITSWCPRLPCLLSYHTVVAPLLFMHVRWHGTSPFSPPFFSSLPVSPLPWLRFSLTHIILPWSCSLSSHLGDILPLRRQEAVCGHARKAADGHRCEKDVRAVRQHRRVHGAARARRHQQR